MKLKCHLALPKEGLVILESEPQYRQLFDTGNAYKARKVPLPYLQFLVRYIKLKNKIHYPGIYGSGLRITASAKPLSSINDDVFFLPTGDNPGGRVCTPHDKDMKGFTSIYDAVNYAVSAWYGLAHNLGYGQNIKQPYGDVVAAWVKTDLEDISKLHWAKSTTPYFMAIKKGEEQWSGYLAIYGREVTNRNGYPAIPTFDTELPATTKITDQPWNKNTELTPYQEEINLRLIPRKLRKKMGETWNDGM